MTCHMATVTNVRLATSRKDRIRETAMRIYAELINSSRGNPKGTQVAETSIQCAIAFEGAWEKAEKKGDLG